LVLLSAIGFTILSVGHYVALTWRAHSSIRQEDKEKCCTEEVVGGLDRRGFLTTALKLSAGALLALTIGSLLVVPARTQVSLFCRYKVLSFAGNCDELGIGIGDQVCFPCPNLNPNGKKGDCPNYGACVGNLVIDDLTVACVLNVRRFSQFCLNCEFKGHGKKDLIILPLPGGWHCS